MNQDAQQRIMGYFIEEARDHLTTIEQGLLSLRESMSDPELINELFRAAHSIKGGSAMLGLSAIQRTAHRMEDFFNIFRSHQGRVPVDQHLETLLLRGFDTLSMLLEELQSPRGLTDEVSDAAIAELEPVFAETESHINHLLSERETPFKAQPVVQAETVQAAFTLAVPALMKEMLELFKRRDQPGIRDHLAQKAEQLAEVGARHHVTQWQELAQAVRSAILEPSTDLRNVALIALRDLKQGQQAALQGKNTAIAPSTELMALAQSKAVPAPAPAPEMTEAQRRILGFFLEEARDHLTTIEQGLLNLKANSSDPDVIEELFRATHSIKGGAAQLGMSSIQGTAHRMEDFFSIFREHPGQVPVDQQLESYLLEGYDTLSRLMDKLQELGHLPEEYGESAWEAIKPVFDQTEAHIHRLMRDGVAAPAPQPVESTSLQTVLNQDIPRLLKQMLAFFKQPNQTLARAQLLQNVQALQGHGEAYSLPQWSRLNEALAFLIANDDLDLRELALPILRDLKQAHHALLAGQDSTIQLSDDLLALMPAATPGPDIEDVATDLDQWLGLAGDDLDGIGSDLAAEDLGLFFEEADGVDATAEMEAPLASDDDLGSLFESMADLGSEAESAEIESHEEIDFPDLTGLGEWGIGEETTEILPPGTDSSSQDSGGANLGWEEQVDATEEDFDLMPLELEDEDEMAFSDLFSNAEELAAMEDPSFDTPTGFPRYEETADSEAASLSQRIGEAKADGDLAGLFLGVAEAEGGETGIADDGVWTEQADPVTGDERAAGAGELEDGGWDSLFSDLESEDSAALSGGDRVDSLSALPDGSDLSDLTSTTGDDRGANDDASGLFGDLFGVEVGDSGSDREPNDSPFSVTDDALESTSIGDAESDLAFEDLFGDSFAPSAVEGVDNVSSQPSSGLDLGATVLEDIPFDGEELSEKGSPFAPPGDSEESFDGLFGALDSKEVGLDDTIALTDESGHALNQETEVEDLELAGFDDLFSDAEDKDNVFAAEPESSTMEDLDSWFMTESNDTVLEDQPLLEESPDTVLEDDSLDSLFELEPTDVSGEPIETAEQQEHIVEEISGSFDQLDAFFANEPEDDSLSLDTATEAFSAFDTDGDGQIDLDELSQFLQGDQEQQPRVPTPSDVADFDQELDSLLGSEFSSDSLDDGPSSSATAAGALDDLDDLVALFDEGSESETVEPQISSAAVIPQASPTLEVPSAGVDFDDELDAILGDISFDDLEPTPAPRAREPLTPPLSVAPLVTQPPTLSPATTSRGPTTRRSTPFNNQTMRVEVRHLDQINNLVGELVVNRNSMEQNQGRLRQFLDGLLVRVQQLSELGQRMQDQYDRSLLETALLASRGEPSLASAIVSGMRPGSHSSGQNFDALEMDRFTAFHALSQEIIELIVRVRESSSDIQFGIDEAEQITRQFRQVTTQLQEGLNRARMVPFSQIADRLPRAIRDLSIKTGKQAALVVDGRETSIDKAILEELYDPMTHLVNNALVHGIESPEERRRQSKPAEGKISIKAFYQGNQSIIVVSDDGAGINVDKVKQKAIGLGLLAPDATEDEIFNVLFHPGFSGRSAEEVDDLAGRGVGLDVVRRNINELRGSIQVDSERGKGTTFTIRLPLTLSISKAMVCVSDKALVAFPLDGVEEMLDVPQDEIEYDESNRPTIPWRDTRLHYQPLSDLLRYSRLHSRSRTEVYSITQDEGIVPIVVLQSAGQHVALQVDSFVEEQEIVIKQLRGPAPKPPGIAGATVLGNGRVLPITDIIELVDMAQGRTRRFMPLMDRDEDIPTVETEHQTTVLIVDDSITVRELLSMTFNKVGYRVEQARDGQDAWEKLRGGLPCDLIFCDIEMPRMDGLELLSRLKDDEALRSKPIAMLTSRGAERHRQTARELGATAYFTKPYLEEELLNAAGRMLKGEQLLVAKS